MSPVQIRSPVKGQWCFMNPPGHHPDAKDFVRVDDRGAPYPARSALRHLFWRLPVTSTYAWAQTVYAPFDGTVIAMKSDADDRHHLNLVRDLVNGLLLAPRRYAEEPARFLGNHVAIASPDGKTALFAHLQKGSVTVRTGDAVQTGEPVGRVGNSGNTLQPHLHFHITREPDWQAATPVPFVFDTVQLRQADIWRATQAFLPANLQRFRT